MILFKRYEYNPQTDLIGKGGFSRVYKALDKKFNRYLALKIYNTSELSERYSPIAEIQRVIELDHPNITRYIDIEEIEKEDSFGQVEKIQVCVMELLEGGNLAKYYNAFYIICTMMSTTFQMSNVMVKAKIQISVFTPLQQWRSYV